MDKKYLVTVKDVGNVTDDAANIHTILTSRDHILPRNRVVVEEAPQAAPPRRESFIYSAKIGGYEFEGLFGQPQTLILDEHGRVERGVTGSYQYEYDPVRCGYTAAELVAGVDYEEASCPVCGSTDTDMSNHVKCMESLDPYGPPSGTIIVHDLRAPNMEAVRDKYLRYSHHGGDEDFVIVLPQSGYYQLNGTEEPDLLDPRIEQMIDALTVCSYHTQITHDNEVIVITSHA